MVFTNFGVKNANTVFHPLTSLLEYILYEAPAQISVPSQPRRPVLTHPFVIRHWKSIGKCITMYKLTRQY